MPDFKKQQAAGCSVCPYRSKRTFCNLADPALETFAAIGSNWNIERGTILYRDDDVCDDAFILCTGLVKLYCTSKTGKTLILKFAQPGEVLGLGELISGARHAATAETVEPSLIKSIRRADFVSFLALHGEASLHASQALSLEGNRALHEIKRLALSGSAAGRLASVLLEWGHSIGRPESEMRFAMTFTHEQLAELLATSRETITRTLRRFQDEELIQIRGCSLRIISPRGLESIID